MRFVLYASKQLKDQTFRTPSSNNLRNVALNNNILLYIRRGEARRDNARGRTGQGRAGQSRAGQGKAKAKAKALAKAKAKAKAKQS